MRRAFSNLQQVTNRSIQRLAADLYAKEVHFVLELVQNCDDCSFAPDVEPALVVDLSATRLEFRSNECGFETRNVLALCSIGESTKTLQAGCIGQKGIGFKSVFKVSRTPAIHSRNFHFEFCAPSITPNVDEGVLGYIIPSPLPIPEGWDARRGTLVVLPLDFLSSASCTVDLEDLRQNLLDIQASLLLFLNKIVSIQVRDTSRACAAIAPRGCGNSGGGAQVHIRKMSKTTLSHGVVEIVDAHTSIPSIPAHCSEDLGGCAEGAGGTGEDAVDVSGVENRTKWVVVDEIFEAEEHVPRPGVDRTKLSLAIPLVPSHTLKRGPPPRDVYAFLPLRSYGFRFILQVSRRVLNSQIFQSRPHAL